MTTSAAPLVPLMNDPRLEFDADRHRYSLDGRELVSVTTALRLAGMVDTSRWNEYARARGDYLHRAIHLYAQRDLDEASIDPALAPYFDAFRQFVADTGVTFERVEQRVCDPILGYAGTLDAIIRWPLQRVGSMRRTLVDWKSGHFPPMAGPQTAAYLRCARAFYPTGTYIARAGLQLRSDGAYRYHELHDTVQDEADFLAALRVCQFRQGHAIP